MIRFRQLVVVFSYTGLNSFYPPQGDFTWSSLSGRSVRLTPVAIQNLSELERARLQEVAYTRLHQDYDLGCQITMPKGESMRACVCFLTSIPQCYINFNVCWFQLGGIYSFSGETLTFMRPLNMSKCICHRLGNCPSAQMLHLPSQICYYATFKCPIK